MSSEIKYKDDTDCVGYVGLIADRYIQCTETTFTPWSGKVVYISSEESPELTRHKQTDYYKWCKRKTKGE